MKSVLAASAVMALAGSSYGAFTLTSLAMSPNAVIAPSSGSLRYDENAVITTTSSGTVYSPAWNGDQLMVTGVAAEWTASRAAINNSTWLGIDPQGPDGSYLGGTNASNNRPMWNDDPANTAGAKFTAALRIGTPVLVGAGDGDDLISSIGGGAAGWGYAPQRLAGNPNGPAGNGAISSTVGGSGAAVGIEKLYIGHFALTDSNAVLQGTILVTIAEFGDPAGFDLNLDGSPFNGLGLIQVRNGGAIDVYVAEIPAPGALAALGLAGLAATRRRR